MPTINAPPGTTTVLPKADMMQMLMPLLMQRLGGANGAAQNGLHDMLAAMMQSRAQASTGAMMRRPAAIRPCRGALVRPRPSLRLLAKELAC